MDWKRKKKHYNVVDATSVICLICFTLNWNPITLLQKHFSTSLIKKGNVKTHNINFQNYSLGYKKAKTDTSFHAAVLFDYRNYISPFVLL